MGTGTQKVVAELRRFVPGARVLRMDRDTLSKQAKEERRIYEKFAAREADVLVGTKLVAKGFHFPDVTLVGVVDADTMIHMPDFRSSERTMQLLSQVAGRSGRQAGPAPPTQSG
jgi:primosomal protein N' (replication factor Y)